MKPFTFYKSKKYFQTVMFSIMLAMALILTGLSVVNTYVLERSIKKVQENSNLKVLTQTQYNLSNMNEIITHLSTFAYNDNLLIPLLFTKTLPQMDYIRGYREMSNLMKSSSFLHSIAVYNASSGELYGSTSDFLVDGGITKAKMMQWLLHPPLPHPTSRLVPVSLKASGQTDAFAFIVTDAFMPFSGDRSALILYIESSWVFDSLSKMNDIGSQAQGQVYIQTSDGRLLSSKDREQTDSLDQAAITQLLERDKKSLSRTSGSVIGNTGREKSIITYMAGIGDWTILYIQPYDLLMKEAREARTKSLLITGAFLLLSIAVSVWLSYKLYDPIENMLRRIRPNAAVERQTQSQGGNELDFMSEHYLRMSEKLQEISSEQIVNKYYIRKFLTDSRMFTQNDMQLLIAKHGLHISVSDPLLVCVLRIERFANYDLGTPGASKKLYSFAIVNIAQEILSRAYPCESVELQSDHFVLILSAAKGSSDFGNAFTLIREFQHTIKQYYNLSLSCGVSSVISQLPQLSTAYHQAYQLSLYTFVAGYQSIVKPEDVRENLTNTRKTLPPDIERKLSEALKKGQLTTAGSELEKAFSLLASFQYEEMRRVVADLAWVVQNTAAEIMNNRARTLAVDVEQIHRIPQEYETLDEIYVALLSLCAKICEGQQPSAPERNELLIGTVKEVIEQKFADLNLSQQSIASNVKLTSAYVGKLFKDSCGVSITEYINEIRLRHAQDLLLKSDYTIAEIMDRCGYANQSYFFRLFKGKFGTTPKDYRIKKMLS
ncbi:helix-turn-helix domain-containing protein [Paenibacillus sp. FSL R10-2734]|uniref:helix-turn-helix domain-containing protein n=1 Tax=Paenibacillus sp. FSL R10-2734 TaxID=2954691 RepID=UPI0030D94C14